MTTGSAADLSFLVDNIRNSFGRVVYSHKTHEKAREIESGRASLVKWINIVLVSSTSGSLLSTVITNQRALLYVSTAMSAATLAFVIFQLSFDPDSASARHRDSAHQLWYVREKYVNLLTDISLGLPEELAVSRRDQLTDELAHVYRHSADTSSRAYVAAQHALKVNEEMSFSVEELDDLLPVSLRLGAKPTRSEM
jgi:hypothetical protein